MVREKDPGNEAAASGGEAVSEAERQARHELDREAASRADIPSAGLGAALTGESRSDETSETALSLKRAVGNEGRP